MPAEISNLKISMKPQKISPVITGTVRELLNTKLKDVWLSPLFKTKVLAPLNIVSHLDNVVQNLSGG